MIIEYCSKLYPEKLRKIENPPSRLYVLGNEKILNDNAISVVGSRTNTKYGEKMCKLFTKGLVEYNINIISGLAIGIDEIAHKTCLENGGKTIAVIPSGLNNIYPTQNKKLAKEILNNGGILISEYEPNTEANSKKFLERNRIVAGLGLGTLVVEAGYRSGTRVTVKYTVEQGKKVFCIPSNLDNIKGKSTNELIRKGAILVTKVDEIIEEYKDIEFTKKEIVHKDIFLNIPKELHNIYKILNEKPKDMNEIILLSGESVNEVNYKLMLLEMEGLIKELPGQRYIKGIN